MRWLCPPPPRAATGAELVSLFAYQQSLPFQYSNKPLLRHKRRLRALSQPLLRLRHRQHLALYLWLDLAGDFEVVVVGGELLEGDDASDVFHILQIPDPSVDALDLLGPPPAAFFRPSVTFALLICTDTEAPTGRSIPAGGIAPGRVPEETEPGRGDPSGPEPFVRNGAPLQGLSRLKSAR